jgi:hypothetical protein
LGKTHLSSIFGIMAAMALTPSFCRATNPCDVSEEACRQWNKALQEQQAQWPEYPSVGIPARACDADPSTCAQQGFDGAGTSIGAILQQGQLPKELGRGMHPARPDVRNHNSCRDGGELNDRAMEVTLVYKETGQTQVLSMTMDACDRIIPRADEEPMPPYTRRTYKTADGAILSVYTGPDRPTATVSLSLPDDSSSASMIPEMSTERLASGDSIELGEVLMVRTGQYGADGAVIPVKMSIRSFATEQP